MLVGRLVSAAPSPLLDAAKLLTVDRALAHQHVVLMLAICELVTSVLLCRTRSQAMPLRLQYYQSGTA